MSDNLSLFGDTLRDAKASLEANLDKGVTCPCCGQFAKRYRRPLHSTIARSLIRLMRLTLTEPALPMHHISTFQQSLTAGRDFCLVAYWELAEDIPVDRENGATRTSGFWRLTEKGRAFVRLEIVIPRYAYIFNAEGRGFDGDSVSIIDCLGKRFNYRELMEGL
jgi:hypothetical protein